MGAAPLPVAPGRGAGPGASGGALLRQCEATATQSCAGPPNRFPPWANPGSWSVRFCSKKVRAEPPELERGEPGFALRSQGTREEPALVRATARGSCLCWPRPERPGKGSSCERLMEFSGRGEGAVRVGLGAGGGRGITVGRNFCCSRACPAPAPEARMGKVASKCGHSLTPTSLLRLLCLCVLMQPRKPTAKRPITGFTTGSSSSTAMVRLPSGPRRQAGAAREGRGSGGAPGGGEPQQNSIVHHLRGKPASREFRLRRFPPGGLEWPVDGGVGPART